MKKLELLIDNRRMSWRNMHYFEGFPYPFSSHDLFMSFNEINELLKF